MMAVSSYFLMASSSLAYEVRPFATYKRNGQDQGYGLPAQGYAIPPASDYSGSVLSGGYGAPVASQGYGAPIASQGYGAPASYGSSYQIEAEYPYYPAPVYSAPAPAYSAYPASSYSAPAYQTPVYSAPAYQAPAPVYQAPTPSYSSSYSAPFIPSDPLPVPYPVATPSSYQSSQTVVLPSPSSYGAPSVPIPSSDGFASNGCQGVMLILQTLLLSVVTKVLSVC